MTVNDLFVLGNKFRQEKNYQMAFGVWAEILKKEPLYGPVHLNMADVFREQGQVDNEERELRIFMNCPVTPVTLDLIGNVKARLDEIQKLKQEKK